MSSVLSSINLNSAHLDLTDRVVINTSIVGSPALALETSVAALTITKALSTTTGVFLLAQPCFTVGTSGVSARLRLYHGTASGTLIGDTGLLTVVAANLVAPSLFAIDTAPTLPNQVYTLTLTIGSGAAASTVSKVALIAIVV